MKISTQIFLGFTIVISLSAINSYVNNLLSKQVDRNTVFLANSEAIIRNSSKLHRGIIEMQSGFRGFLLTDDENFLDAYYSGLKVIPKLFREERKLVFKSPSQTAKLDSIHSLHNQWLIYASALIASKVDLISSENVNSNYQDLFDTQLKKQVGKNLNEQITYKFNEFDRHEYMIREARRQTLTRSIENTKTFSLVFVFLIMTIGFISSFYMVRLISRRITLMVNLAENLSKGNFAIVTDNKNDELTSLSKSLNIMSLTLSKNIKELEKRNTELDQFAYAVSHDLKAPIRGIYNVIQWIEEDLGTELSLQMRKYLNIIPDRIRRMEDLIHGLLDYARISREKPLKEQVDTNILVKDIVEQIVPKNFNVEIDKLPTITVEKIRMQQVFSNLISNAVRYSSNANGRISIGCRELKEVYEFKVSDNGIGIAPEYHDKIFEIFQTLREKNAEESTGIGLAIVKKIIDDQNCTIKVKSVDGKGATFKFTWPKR